MNFSNIKMFYICTNFKGLIKRGLSYNRFIYSLLLVVLCTLSYGQRHEIGLRAGMSHLVGDIGKTNYLIQKPFLRDISEMGVPFYGGIVYRMNFNPHQSLRFDLGYNHLQFDDARSKDNFRKNRNLKGTNSIYEADVLFEYYFFPVNEEQKSMLSPYIFGGISGMYASIRKLIVKNDFRRTEAGPQTPISREDFETNFEQELERQMVVSIPFGVGLKYKFNYNWALSGEFMFRPTFSDGIDYSQINKKDVKVLYNKDIAEKKKSILSQTPYKEVADKRLEDYLNEVNVGNKHSKDWVNSITLSLTYSFGRPPCYCESK